MPNDLLAAHHEGRAAKLAAEWSRFDDARLSCLLTRGVRHTSVNSEYIATKMLTSASGDVKDDLDGRACRLNIRHFLY